MKPLSTLQWRKPKNTTGYYETTGRLADGMLREVSILRTGLNQWDIRVRLAPGRPWITEDHAYTASLAKKWVEKNLLISDVHGNKVAREGQDFCSCGCKYWENDRCIDCGESVRSDSSSQDSPASLAD